MSTALSGIRIERNSSTTYPGTSSTWNGSTRLTPVIEDVSLSSIPTTGNILIGAAVMVEIRETRSLVVLVAVVIHLEEPSLLGVELSTSYPRRATICPLTRRKGCGSLSILGGLMATDPLLTPLGGLSLSGTM